MEWERMLFILQIWRLHEMNVIHRDLKLPNILISNGILKIGDLGFAKRLDDRVSIKTIFRNNKWGKHWEL